MPRATAITIAFLAASFTACATDEDPDPGQMMQQSVVPQAGSWYYAGVTPISSNCSAGDDGVAGSFLILSPSAAGFTVDDGDVDPFNCSLSGGSFNCPNRASHIEDLRPTYDAVITAHATATGTFSSPTRGSGTQDATVDCAGTACSAAGNWPCQFKVSFQIAAN